MLLYFVLLTFLFDIITCGFPTYIFQCPLPDPNAGDCILKNARYAIPFLLQGDPSLNLIKYYPYKYVNDLLLLGNNAEILINGQALVSPDTDLYVTRINLAKKYWDIKLGSPYTKYDFNFTMNVYDNYDLIRVKGQIKILQENWVGHFIGHYESQKINDQYYMQVPNIYYNFIYDNFQANYIGITKMNNSPLQGDEMTKVMAAFKFFEKALYDKDKTVGKFAIKNSLNTILGTVPQDAIFS